MHLMYTLNENGERIYTLKVTRTAPFSFLSSHRLAPESNYNGQNDKVCTSRSAPSSPFPYRRTQGQSIRVPDSQPGSLQMTSFLVTGLRLRRGTASSSPNNPQSLGSSSHYAIFQSYSLSPCSSPCEQKLIRVHEIGQPSAVCLCVLKKIMYPKARLK